MWTIIFHGCLCCTGNCVLYRIWSISLGFITHSILPVFLRDVVKVYYGSKIGLKLVLYSGSENIVFEDSDEE